MKRFVFAVCLLLILTSCGARSVDFQNSDNYCRIENNIYEASVTGNRVFMIDRENSNCFEGFCRDPLCTHNSEFCLDNKMYWIHSVATDGEFLYSCGINANLASNGITRQIYRVKPDFSDLTLLCTYEISGSTSTELRVSDGYIWFMQGFFNDDYDPNRGVTERSDQYARLMRIPANGGKIEDFLGIDLDICTKFYICGGSIFLINPDGTLDIIDISSKETRKIAADSFEGFPDTVAELSNEIFIETVETENLTIDSASFSKTKVHLYKMTDGNFEKIADSDYSAVLGSDSIWLEEIDYSFLGTKNMPTGRPGETADCDYFRLDPRAVYEYNVNSGSIKDYTPGDGFSDGDSVRLIACAGGYLIGYVSNYVDYYETGDNGLRICVIEPREGKLNIVGELKEVI